MNSNNINTLKRTKNVNGSYVVMKKEIRLLFKSKIRIFLLFMIPIIILIVGLLGSAFILFGDDTIEPTQIWVIDESTGEYSTDLMTLWATLNNTELEVRTEDYNELQKNMDFDVLVLIPTNFSALISANQTAQLNISYSANDPKNQYVTISIFQLTELYDASMVQIQNPDVQFNLIDADIQEVSEDDSKEGADEEIAKTLMIIPIYIILFIVISPISLVLISVTIEREQRTLEVLFLQPVKRKSIVLGKILYGVFLVLATLILDVIAGLVSYLLLGMATIIKGTSDENGESLFEILQADVIIMFFLCIVAITITSMSFAVFLSLLAKDEKEANMISGIFPLFIMGIIVIIYVVPIADMEVMGQFVFSIIPVLGIIIAIYLSTLAGGVVPLAYVALVAQVAWTVLIISMTTRLSEEESILELSYGKAFKELKHAIFRKRKK
ncbi:MAG: ABC transporter permease [Candidatus Hodarchaeales archaeon]|jgi:ABC-type Na+ efflux pump permease subunit